MHQTSVRHENEQIEELRLQAEQLQHQQNRSANAEQQQPLQVSVVSTSNHRLVVHHVAVKLSHFLVDKRACGIPRPTLNSQFPTSRASEEELENGKQSQFLLCLRSFVGATELADKILEVALSTPSISVNEVQRDNQIDFSPVFRSRRSKRNYNHESPAPTRNAESSDRDFWYHSKFQQYAKKCVQFSGNNKTQSARIVLQITLLQHVYNNLLMVSVNLLLSISKMSTKESSLPAYYREFTAIYTGIQQFRHFLEDDKTVTFKICNKPTKVCMDRVDSAFILQEVQPSSAPAVPPVPTTTPLSTSPLAHQEHTLHSGRRVHYRDDLDL
ncbi:hypothetical protein J6590_037030 [Homalodisca vitripennis]|nr:hypothetical protein J6590_037030 [Homalodisca vitripennis]